MPTAERCLSAGTICWAVCVSVGQHLQNLNGSLARILLAACGYARAQFLHAQASMLGYRPACHLTPTC